MNNLKLVSNNGRIITDNRFIFRASTLDSIYGDITFNILLSGNDIDISVQDSSRAHFTCFNQNKVLDLVKEEVYFMIGESIEVDLSDETKLKYNCNCATILI